MDDAVGRRNITANDGTVIDLWRIKQISAVNRESLATDRDRCGLSTAQRTIGDNGIPDHVVSDKARKRRFIRFDAAKGIP